MALGKKTGGRVKGTPNKTTRAIKEMVIQALDEAGGVNYLLEQAATNPTAFMTLVGKVLPLQVEGDMRHAVTVKGSLEWKPAQ